jgi:hypothetical protein
MKQKFYTPHVKKDNNKISVVAVDLAHIPSPTHKWGAIKNKSQVFEDKRKKPPKYKAFDGRQW